MIEQKYILDSKKYNELMRVAKHHLKKDNYYKSTICNIYFDNFDKDEEGLPLKERLRLRSYKVPKINDKVFLEIKNEDTNTKRSVGVNLKEFYNYLLTGKMPNVKNKQIMEEIDYAIRHYNLRPMLFIAYDRLSYIDKDDERLKITFDKNMRSRKDNLRLEKSDNGKPYFEETSYIMKLKTNGYLPIWLTKLLSMLSIYPEDFSKYDSAYQKNYILA